MSEPNWQYKLMTMVDSAGIYMGYNARELAERPFNLRFSASNSLRVEPNKHYILAADPPVEHWAKPGVEPRFMFKVITNTDEWREEFEVLVRGDGFFSSNGENAAQMKFKDWKQWHKLCYGIVEEFLESCDPY